MTWITVFCICRNQRCALELQSSTVSQVTVSQVTVSPVTVSPVTVKYRQSSTVSQVQSVKYSQSRYSQVPVQLSL